MPTAQETNLANVGGTEAEPAQVSGDQVIGWVGQGFSIFSTVLGTIVAAEGNELVGTEGTGTPANAGTLTVTDPNTGALAIVQAAKIWIPVTIGVVALLGLMLVVLARR